MHSRMLSTSIYVQMNECMHEPTLFLKLQNPLLNEFLQQLYHTPTPTPGVPFLHMTPKTPSKVSDFGEQSEDQFACSQLSTFNLKAASLVAQKVKRLPAMWETQVQSLGWEDPQEKEMAIHSGTLAWKIPWTEKPGRLWSMGLQSWTRVSNFIFTFPLI